MINKKHTWDSEEDSKELESIQDFQYTQEREDKTGTKNTFMSNKQLFAVYSHG